MEPGTKLKASMLGSGLGFTEFTVYGTLLFFQLTSGSASKPTWARAKGVADRPVRAWNPFRVPVEQSGCQEGGAYAAGISCNIYVNTVTKI